MSVLALVSVFLGTQVNCQFGHMWEKASCFELYKT